MHKAVLGGAALGVLLNACSLLNQPKDHDPCVEGEEVCGQHGTCQLEGDGFRCECTVGYENVDGAASECEDRDECSDGSHLCDEVASCSNESGTYTCSCPLGYLDPADGRECVELGKSMCDHDCDVTQSCLNLEGVGYECVCNDGYTQRPDGSCDDIHECDEDLDDCVAPARCVNEEGGFHCMCPTGLAQVSPTECERIDPCAAHECGANTRCVRSTESDTSTGADYRCECMEGYERRAGGLCLDIDECRNEPCKSGATCANLEGSFECRCPGYFELDEQGLGCVDNRLVRVDPFGTSWQLLVQTDANRNLFVFATFDKTIELCGESLTPRGGADVFVAMYDSERDCQWHQQIGGTGQDEVWAAAIDREGNPVLTASYYGRIDVAGAPLDSGGYRGRFVAKLNRLGGSAVWAQPFLNIDPDATGELNPLNWLASDRDGNVFWATRIPAGVALESSVHAGNLDWDGLIVELGAVDGEVQWQSRLGGTAQAMATGVVVDPDGAVVVSGLFRSAVDIGGQTLLGTDRWEGFVAKFAVDRTVRWRRRIEADMEVGTALERGNKLMVAANSDGELILGGTFEESLRFGATTLSSPADQDVFVAALAADGEPLWARGFGGSGIDWIGQLVVDSQDRIAIGGAYTGEIDFGEGPLVADMNQDIYVASLDPAGNPRWAQRFGGAGQDWNVRLAVGPLGDLFVSGVFVPPVEFDDIRIVNPVAPTDMLIELQP